MIKGPQQTLRQSQRSRKISKKTKRSRQLSRQRSIQGSPSLFLVQALNTVFLDVSTFAQKQGKVYYPMSADDFFQELDFLFAYIGRSSAKTRQMSQHGGSFMARTAEFFGIMRDSEYLSTTTRAIVGDFDTPCNAIISSMWLLSYAAMAYNITTTRKSGTIRQIADFVADPVKHTILKYFEQYLSSYVGSTHFQRLTGLIEYFCENAARKVKAAPEPVTQFGIRQALNWLYRKLPTSLFVKSVACISYELGIDSCSVICFS